MLIHLFQHVQNALLFYNIKQNIAQYMKKSTVVLHVNTFVSLCNVGISCIDVTVSIFYCLDINLQMSIAMSHYLVVPACYPTCLTKSAYQIGKLSHTSNRDVAFTRHSQDKMQVIHSRRCYKTLYQTISNGKSEQCIRSEFCIFRGTRLCSHTQNK